MHATYSLMGIAGAVVHQLKPAENISIVQLQHLRQIYPAVSSLFLCSTKQQLVAVQAVFPEVSSLCVRYKAHHQLPIRLQMLCPGALSHLKALRSLHLVDMQSTYLSSISQLTGLSSLCIQADAIQRYYNQQSPFTIDCVSTIHGLTHLQTIGCPSIKCLQRLQCLVSLKFGGTLSADAAKCLSQLTRLECNLLEVPHRMGLSQLQLMSTLRQIQSLTRLRHLALKVKEFNGLSSFSSLPNLTVLKLDTSTQIDSASIASLGSVSALHNLTLRHQPCYGMKKQSICVKQASSFRTTSSLVKSSYLDFFGERL